MFDLERISLSQATLLINHGPTAIVTAQDEGVLGAKTVSWMVPIGARPPQLAVCLGDSVTTRMIANRREFAINVPPLKLLELTAKIGTTSGATTDKFQEFGVQTWPSSEVHAPLIRGCLAFLECRIPEFLDVERTHDLFIANVVAAWAKPDIFRDGIYHFMSKDDATFHHTSNCRFYLTSINVHHSSNNFNKGRLANGK